MLPQAEAMCVVNSSQEVMPLAASNALMRNDYTQTNVNITIQTFHFRQDMHVHTNNFHSNI